MPVRSANAPVTVKLPVEGSYSSGFDTLPGPAQQAVQATPPAIKTFPLVNSVAVAPFWPATGLPVRVNRPVDGSYNSAVVVVDSPITIGSPPTISTRPSGSRVAVCHTRGTVIRPV